MKNELILSTNTIQDIKDEYTASQKKNLDEINNSSKEIAKLKIDFLKKDDEKSIEIFKLKGEINKLLVEFFSLKDEVCAIKKNIHYLLDNTGKTPMNEKQSPELDKNQNQLSDTEDLKMKKMNFEEK